MLGICILIYVLLVLDMMPSINDFLVILIIPFLEYIVYPHLEHTMGFSVLPLHKVSKSYTLKCFVWVCHERDGTSSELLSDRRSVIGWCSIWLHFCVLVIVANAVGSQLSEHIGTKGCEMIGGGAWSRNNLGLHVLLLDFWCPGRTTEVLIAGTLL